MSFRRLLYSLFLYLIFPFVILRLFWRSRASPAYRQRIFERLGFVKKDSNKPILWVHAVSVGETIAAKPFIEGLLTQYPEHQVLVTTTTPTGSVQVKALFSNRVAHVYFPYDLPEIIYRFLNRMKPVALIIVETEIWPNLYRACEKRNIPLFLINARLSEKSTKSYFKIKGLIAETLACVDKIAVRSSNDKSYFLQLGAKDSQVIVTGNIKYDFSLNNDQFKKGKNWQKEWGEKRKVFVAASTHEGEDTDILAIYQSLLNAYPQLILVLIPRHPERFDSVYKQCQSLEKAGIQTQRHSFINQENTYNNFKGNIILGDTMGEMQSWYTVADVVFIGGSLVKTGGHNPLEATALGKPVVSGRHMFNFADVTPELVSQGLLFSYKNTKEISGKISELLALPRNSFLKKSTAIMRQKSGITARLLKIFSDIYK